MVSFVLALSLMGQQPFDSCRKSDLSEVTQCEADLLTALVHCANANEAAGAENELLEAKLQLAIAQVEAKPAPEENIVLGMPTWAAITLSVTGGVLLGGLAVALAK